MAYDLAVSGFAGFARYGRVLTQRKIARDPLLGIVDGSNKSFYTNYHPLLTSGSAAVYVGLNQVGGTADFETGEITLTNSPTDQPVATYTFTPYTATQILQFVISGFEEMEGRWTRGWKLVDDSGNLADESSANLFVADKNGADPDCGGILFSQSPVQWNFLMACCEYRYALSQFLEAGISDFQYREGLRGMLVDKTRRPQNLSLVMAEVDKRVQRAMLNAQDAFYTAGEHLGAYVPSPVTLEYAQLMEWQTDSKAQDNRSQLGYQIVYRPLTVYP
jgi:hypothetical protein